MKLRLRWFNKIYALALGYFWLPCPMCGKEFGGHEWTDGYAGIPKISEGGTWLSGTGTGVCPECSPYVNAIHRLVQLGVLPDIEGTSERVPYLGLGEDLSISGGEKVTIKA